MLWLNKNRRKIQNTLILQMYDIYDKNTIFES
jgi:hypothetical protein